MWPFKSEDQKAKEIQDRAEQFEEFNKKSVEQQKKNKEIMDELQKAYPVGFKTEFMEYPVCIMKAYPEIFTRFFKEYYHGGGSGTSYDIYYKDKLVVELIWMDDLGHKQEEAIRGSLELLKKLIKPKKEIMGKYPDSAFGDNGHPV